MNNSKYILIISYAIIGVVFYLLDQYNTFINDDVFYAFIYETPQKIESLTDIINSQIDHYLHRNGRFVVHCVVQFFCGILEPRWFYIINTFVFLIFLYVVCWYIFRYTKNNTSLLAITIFALFFIFPRWRITTIGFISGSVNYLWCALFYLLFIIMFEKERKKKRNVGFFTKIFYFLLALVIGSLQESFCIGISAFFLLFYSVNYKSFKGSVIPLVVGFLVGSAFVVFAPGNFVRFEESSSHNPFIFRLISNSTSLLFGSIVLPLLIITSSLMFCRKRELFISIFKQHDILFFSIFFNSLFVAIIAYKGHHQLTSISFFSIIILLILLYRVMGDKIIKYSSYINYGVFLVLIASSCYLYQERKKISLAYDEMWENARITNNGIVVDEKYDSLSTLKKNWLQSNFTRYIPIDFYERKWMSLYLTEGKDEHHCRVVLPDKPDAIVNYCVPKYQVSHNVYKPTHKNYYILVTHGEPSSTKTIHVVSESFPKFAIINMIKTGSPNTVQDIPLSSLLDYFTMGNNTYYIYRDFQETKALSVELRQSES